MFQSPFKSFSLCLKSLGGVLGADVFANNSLSCFLGTLWCIVCFSGRNRNLFCVHEQAIQRHVCEFVCLQVHTQRGYSSGWFLLIWKRSFKVYRNKMGQFQEQIQAGLRMDWEQPCWEGLGMLVDEKLNMTNVCSQPRKPTVSWAVWKAVWPAGRGSRFCPSSLLWWDHTWSP